MDPLKSTPAHPRDPLGSANFYGEKLADMAEMVSLSEAGIREDPSPENVAIRWQMIAGELHRGLPYWYAGGCDVDEVVQQVERLLTSVETALRLHAGCEGLRPYLSPLMLNSFGTAMQSFAVLAFSACLSPTPALMKRSLDLIDTRFGSDQLFEVIVHAFDAQRPLSGKYKKEPPVQSWTEPVLVALSQPADKRAAALAAHMKNWPSLMRGFGLKAKPREYHDLFPYFAFDVALAVCAFDIDDSSFRDHPHYPRDLVEYYRANVRHTRDADRPVGIDPGLPPMEIKKPPKADLAKSKRKGLARWVELVTDGDTEAVESVIEKTGKPRKVEDAWDLMCALSEDVNHAVHADIKDDMTAAGQAEFLVREREIGEFVAPEAPPAGGARVYASLRALGDWLPAKGYTLFAIDNDDDAVHAVAVRSAFVDEFSALSASLGIRLQSPAEAYSD